MFKRESSCAVSPASMFLIGVAIGTGAALLFAPASGEQMRKGIRRRANEGRRTVQDRISEAGDKASAFVHDSREKAAVLMEQAHAMVDSRVQQLTDEKERLAAAIRAGREAYRSAVPEATA